MTGFDYYNDQIQLLKWKFDYYNNHIRLLQWPYLTTIMIYLTTTMTRFDYYNDFIW
jgi:hypothetical protein